MLKGNVKNNKMKSILSVSIVLVCVLTLVIGVITVSAGGAFKNGLLFSCDFDGSATDLVSGNKGVSENVQFSENSLHINNGHRAGNSRYNATSFVEFGKIDNIKDGDFTVAFDYFANEPTNVLSVVLSTGKLGEGFNIFNKGGLGISIGDVVMKTDRLNKKELSNGGVRLDSNLLNDGKKHEVLITVERNNSINLYVDGFFRERATLSAIRGSRIASDTLMIGASADKKYGSEDMYIDNLRIYNKICNKNGEALFDEYQWLVASKKAHQVLVDYSDLAGAKELEKLQVATESNLPKNKAEVKSSVAEVENAIKDVIKSAKGKETNNFQVLADTHMMTSNNSSKESLMDSLTNISQWFSDTSALVVAGDLTDNGYDVQYKKFYDALRKCNKAPYTMNITGNHESSYNDTTMEEDNERFLSYNNAYTSEVYGWTTDKIYYDKWINGYHFIGLGSEATLRDGGHAFFSAEQIQFLKDKLAESYNGEVYDSNKPIFVFNHQPITDTTPNSDEFGVGAQAGELKEIFKDYPQIVYVSGHVHNGYVGAEAVYNQGFGTLVDTPCLRANEAVRYTKSIGYNVSVYGDKVIFTPVNFTDDDIMYDMTIVIDRNMRDTKTAKYDIRDVSVKAGIRDLGNGLTDSANSSYFVFRENEEIVYTFNKAVEVGGIRIGTTYWNKPAKMAVAFSLDGKTYGDWQEFSLNTATDLQKVFVNRQTAIKMKVKFGAMANITMLTPTVK